MELRGYRAGDADGMYELDRVCFEERFQFSRRTMRGFAEAERALTVVAEVDGVMVGFAIGEFVEGAVYLVTLDVDPACRRGGVARRMMGWLDERAREAGVGRIELHVFAGNDGAIRFYEGLGFGLEGRVRGFYGAGMDGLVYRRALG